MNSLDCTSPDCSSFRFVPADAQKLISLSCRVQNSVPVRIAVFTRVFQASV